MNTLGKPVRGPVWFQVKERVRNRVPRVIEDREFIIPRVLAQVYAQLDRASREVSK